MLLMPSRASAPLALTCLLTGALSLTACGASGEGDESPTPTPGSEATPTASPTPDTSTATEVSGGNVSGDWCGKYLISGDITVPSGSSLMVCAGSELHFAASVGLRVEGTLHLMGEAGNLIRLDAATTTAWDGVTVAGSLHGAFADINGASIAVNGLNSSAISLKDSQVYNSNFTLQLNNGGAFERTQVTGGNTVYLYGGALSMVDTIIDLGHDGRAPDCLNVSGGSISLDHAHITGCHCPLHITATTQASSITNSILDGAADAIMIASTVATITGNHIEGSENDILDIGGTATGISAVVSGNYWSGGAPDISTKYSAQFVGASDYVTSPIEGVGPRL